MKFSDLPSVLTVRYLRLNIECIYLRRIYAGHIGKCNGIVLVPNQADKEASFFVGSIETWESSPCVDWRKLRAGHHSRKR